MRYSILILSLALAACATTGSGSGVIMLETTSKGQPLTGANCVIHTGAGNWTVATPGTVVVGSPSGDLHVVCDKPGYRTSELIYKPSSGGYPGSSLGIGVGGGGGHVGMGVGLSFPIMLGGGAYPARITVEMNPQ